MSSDAVRELRVYLEQAGIKQVADCDTDDDVIRLTLRVMRAMTQAYKTVSTMLETTMNIKDEEGTKR